MSMMSSKTWGLIKIASSVAQDNYPEIMGATWVVNSPMIFTGVWAMVKAFLDEKTQKKIGLKGNSFQKELFTIVDKENVLKFIGGTSCPDQEDDAVLQQDMGPWNDYKYERETGKIVKKE